MTHLLDLTNTSENPESDELCRFCLVPINLDAEDIIQPCSCITYIEGELTDRIYSYCHGSCFTDYRVQRADNNCYTQCEDCKTFYAFGLNHLSRAEDAIFSIKTNRVVRYVLCFVWFVLYLGVLIGPIFGFMILWRFTNHLSFSNLLMDENLNLGTWFPYYLLGSLTWSALLGFYWCCCVRDFCGEPLHHHSRYHRGYRQYYGSYSGVGYYPFFFHSSSTTTGGSGGENNDVKGLLIVVLLLLLLIALILAGVLIYICVELTNLRYKKYVKRLGAVKYKVIPNFDTPPGYQPEPSAPPPPYVECGYNGWI